MLGEEGKEEGQKELLVDANVGREAKHWFKWAFRSLASSERHKFEGGSQCV